MPDLGQVIAAAVPADRDLQPEFTAWINAIRVGTLLPNANAVGLPETGRADPAWVKKRISEFYDAAMQPKPWIVVDQEGGQASQFSSDNGMDKIPPKLKFDFTPIPSLKKLATLPRVERLAFVRTQAKELVDSGVNWVFAPVVDLGSANPVIGKRERAASADPAVTAQVISEVIEEFQRQGVMATAKHFPGHGSVAQDSHLGLATSTKTWDELKKSDLIPFQKAIASHVGAVMTGHIQIQGEKGPASLSPKMVRERLRKEMKFNGLIVTDGLWMKGVGDSTANQVAIQAIRAGNDVLTVAMGLSELQSLYRELCNQATSDSQFKSMLLGSINRVKKLKRAQSRSLARSRSSAPLNSVPSSAAAL